MKHNFSTQPRFKLWHPNMSENNYFSIMISGCHLSTFSRPRTRRISANNSQIQIMPPCLGGTRAREAPRISDCCFFYDSKMHNMPICSYDFGNSVTKHLCINEIIYHHFFFIFSKFEAYPVIS